MFGYNNELGTIQNALNRSQSRVCLQLCDAEKCFADWQSNPGQKDSRDNLLTCLKQFRQKLDEHFARVAGEGYLERAVSLHPSMTPQLQEIEQWQARLLAEVDAIIGQVQTSTNVNISELATRFHHLHDEVLHEEREERHLIERGYA